jgi:ATP:ADP antiporter, AAA family
VIKRLLPDALRSSATNDAPRLAAIMAFFFVVVCAVGILRPIKNSLALDGLGATDFYKVYLVSAAAVLIVPPYNRLADRYSPRWLIPGAAFFFALNLVLFRALYVEGSATYGILFYGWYDLFSAALVTQFFMATQHFFDARSAKGAYPLVVAGGAVGATLGGVITGLFARSVGTPNLLLVAAALIVVFGVGLPLVWRSVPSADLAPGLRRVEGVDAAGLRTVFANPQVRLIAASVLLTVVVKQLVDYQFNVITKEVFVTRDAVTAFQGAFNAATQWLPIVVVIALRPLMKRYGVGLAVYLLPAFMLVTTFGIAVWWSLATVVAAKAAETSLRYSAERTGREILYVPVPEEIKLKAKAYIDVAVEKGLGKLVSAGLIFVLLTVSGPGMIGYVAVVLAALWMVAAVAIRREYVRTLAASIRGRVASLRGLHASLADASTLPVVRQALTGGDTLQAAFALDLVRQAEPEDVDPLAAELHDLLDHPADEIRARSLAALSRLPEAVDPARVRDRLGDPSPAVREAAIRVLCLARPLDRASLLADLLARPEPAVRTAALACLARGDFGSNGAAEVGHAYLVDRAHSAQASDREARLEVALAAGLFRADPGVQELLEGLVGDPDPDVASAALRSAALLQREAFYPGMIEGLASPGTREAARDALARQGGAAIPALSAALLDGGTPDAVRRVIPSVLARIPTQESVGFLLRSLLDPKTDQLLDYRTLKALSKLRGRHAELRFDPAVVRSALEREVDCARLYLDAARLLGARERGGPRAALLERALGDGWRERREGAFRCLGLLHDPVATYRCYLAVSGGQPAARGNALEWLEQTVGHAVFRLLAPVLGEGGGRSAAPSLESILARLCADENRWVARCAHAAAAELDVAVLVPFDGKLRVAAGPGMTRLLADGAAAETALDQAVATVGDTSMDLIEKVFLLQGVDLLQGARTDHLALLASIAEEVEAAPGTVLLRRAEPTDALYIVVRGAVDLQADGQAIPVSDGTGFGTWALIDESPSIVDAVVRQPSRLLRIARTDFYDLLADHPELGVGLLQGLARRVRALVS